MELTWLLDAFVLALLGLLIFVVLPFLATLIYFSIEALIDAVARFTKNRR